MKFHFWYTAFSLFFIGLLAYGYQWLAKNGLLNQDMSIGNSIIVALAVMRLVRLFTYDKITQFIRDWFKDARPDSFRDTLGELLDCPWCTGLWFSAFVAFFYFAWNGAWYFILILAVASVATFLQLLANLVGWHAEGKKRNVAGS